MQLKDKLNIASIQTKLVAYFILLITVPLVVTSYLSYNRTAQSIEEMVSQSTIQAMGQTNKYLDLIFSDMHEVSMQIFADQSLQNDFRILHGTMEVSPYDIAQIGNRTNETLRRIEMAKNVITSIYIINDENTSFGNDLNRLALNNNIKAIKNTYWYKKAVELDGVTGWIGPHVDNLGSSAGSNRETISLVRAFKSIATGRLYGIIKININASYILESIKDMELGETGEILLVSPDNKVISSTFDASHNVNTIVKDIHITEMDYYKTVVESTQTDGSFTYTQNNEEMLVIYFKNTSTDWKLLGIVPTRELIASAVEIRNQTFSLTLFFAVIAVFLGLIISVGMAKPLKALMKDMRLAEEGDLTVHYSSKRKDEIGMLAKSFNQMIDNIKTLVGNVLNITVTVSESANTVASTSEETSAISDEVSRTIQEIAKGAAEQALNAETGVNKMEILAKSINEVMENAKLIDDVTQQTKSLTVKGLNAVELLKEKSNDTTSITAAILDGIYELESESKVIGKILQTMNNIADQTNLLALNAAIEAAKAGEMGRGFSVVANEVRKLAEQSQNSTGEIAKIIKGVQSKTINTVKTADQVKQVVETQNNSVREANMVLTEISNAMETLIGKIQGINEAATKMETQKNETLVSIENISSLSQQTAASTEEVSASTQEQLSAIEELASHAQQLNEAARTLSESINKFKI